MINNKEETKATKAQELSLPNDQERTVVIIRQGRKPQRSSDQRDLPLARKPRSLVVRLGNNDKLQIFETA